MSRDHASRPVAEGLSERAVREHYRALSSTYTERANRTCEATYRRLVRDHVATSGCVLEVGAGSSSHLDSEAPGRGVALDLSWHMLARRKSRSAELRLAASGERLPFGDGSFDSVFSVNVLEHVPCPRDIMREQWRVLRPGGIVLAVTPNGAWRLLLDVAERLRLKLPEGPHRFLSPEELRAALPENAALVRHETLLTVPAGPAGLARLIDRVAGASALRWGFFQFVVARKPGERGEIAR